MSLIAAAPPLVRTTPPSDPAPLGTVTAGSWWPEIELAELRDAMRLDGTITPQRLLPAVQEAMATTIGLLSTWATEREAEGHASLAFVPALGPILGALLAENWGWHAIFWLLALGTTPPFLHAVARWHETLPPGQPQVRSAWPILKSKPFWFYTLAFGTAMGTFLYSSR